MKRQLNKVARKTSSSSSSDGLDEIHGIIPVWLTAECLCHRGNSHSHKLRNPKQTKRQRKQIWYGPISKIHNNARHKYFGRDNSFVRRYRIRQRTRKEHSKITGKGVADLTRRAYNSASTGQPKVAMITHVKKNH